MIVVGFLSFLERVLWFTKLFCKIWLVVFYFLRLCWIEALEVQGFQVKGTRVMLLKFASIISQAVINSKYTEFRNTYISIKCISTQP